MKRFFYIMFTCACALFGFVVSANAAPEGTYVTISYKVTGPGAKTYYLAVDNGAVTTTDTYSDNCVWIRTNNTNTTAFWSVTAEQYLSISTSSSYPLILQGTERLFTNNSGKLSFSQRSNRTTYYYYITFPINTNTKKFQGNRSSSNANGATALSIEPVDYNPLHTLTLDSPTQGDVTANQIKTIRLSVDATIGNVNENNISLTNATIDSIKVENNQLVITTKAPYADGDCFLTIEEGAVVGTDGVDFAEFTASWTISPYTFTSFTPNKTPITASELKEIRVSTNDEIGSIADESKITLTNATIDAITFENNQLVIATKAPYTEGTCTLTISKGAVVGTDGVDFAKFPASWTISPYTFTSVTPKIGKAGSFSVITLTSDVAIKQAPTSGFTLGTKTIGNGLTVALSDDKKQLTITSNTILKEGAPKLSIAKGAVVAEDGIDFAAATYEWTIITTPQFIDVTPSTGTTNGFNTITLTTSIDIEEELRFGYYAEDQNKKLSFEFTDGTTTLSSIATKGLAVNKIDSRTLELTFSDNLGEGNYSLKIQEGAINSKDGRKFPAATYNWTVNAHQFGAVQPASLNMGDYLEQIIIPSADPSVIMSIPQHNLDQIGEWFELKNAGQVTIPVTAAIVDNKLVITPISPLGNGIYTLTVKKGAVVGPHGVPFNEISKTWNVIVSVSITHINGFYPALGAGGYQQVHTVERTIYYSNDETSIPLTLAETNFFGYMRWYNYDTDDGSGITWVNNDAPRSNNGNFVVVSDNTTHLGWFAWNRSNTTGNPVDDGGTGGVLNTGDGSNQTPNINISGWTGSRTIACDVSHYLDYTVTRVDSNIVSVKEPRLSYRQLFHFKPASEMADKFAALKENEYLEEYTYMAPTGTNVYLSTEFRYDGDDAENCYFYYDGTSIKRVTSATWSTGVEWDAPYGVVSSNKAGTKIYILTSGTLRIAKFTVTYVDKAKYGPVKETGANGSAKALMSYAEMNAKFEVLEYNNFSFGKTPNSSAQEYLTTPLPYDQSTYGFSHMASDAIKPNDDHHVPYYGEYGIVNRIGGEYWEQSANHVDGGATVDEAAAQGFGIYVDGTTKPGVVASISTQVTICAERTMYCSVWLRCPRPKDDGSYKPIFRCNVQGRNKRSNGEYTPWEDVGVYFAGELSYASGWNQVNFPIESQETYSECRVQIYNFGTGGNGNDFWLDDLCIYADKLPMASYQLQTEMCCSPNHDGTTFTAAVLRVDYGTTTLTDNTYQYYQIYNKTTKKPLTLTAASLSPYYHEDASEVPEGFGLTKEQFGSILVRSHDYNPTQEEGAKICDPGTLIGELLGEYNSDSTKPLWGKCYVAKDSTTTSPGKYYMYVVHIIPNISDNRIQENYLQEQCEYTLRMTSEASDLLNTTLSCAVEIDLPATQQSLFRLMSDQIETTEFSCNSTNNCANELYTLEAFIRKDSDPYSDQGKAEGTYLADWMYGHAFDEVYRMDYPHENDATENVAKDTADAKFARAYHCSREQVTNAFLDLRRVPTPPADTNPNYYAKTFGEISPLHFSDYRQEADTPSLYYETLKYLHNQGWLQLATSSVSFYLGSESKARYWVFPIENSATAEDGVTPLHDCPEPRWVEVSSKASPYYVNVAPGVDISSEVAKEAADPRTGTRIPNVRVLARLVNNTIQIPIHQASMNDYAVNFTGDDGYIYLTNDDEISNPKAQKYTCSRSDDVITLIPAAGNDARLRLGKYEDDGIWYPYTYTLCVRMRNKDNQYKPVGDNCDVGKIYMKLLILPDVVYWTPTTDNDNWHDDANWSGSGEDNAYHYAPIAGSGVVIQNNGHSPVLTELDSANHPHPMDANFALTPTCGQIYFHPGAMMLNQHLLQHDKVFVDLVVPNQTWNTITVPISGVVSGDMYIPHWGDENEGGHLEDGGPFEVKEFMGSRVSTSAFPFWLSFYNRTVERVHVNSNKTTEAISTNTAAFAPTNSLNEPMEVGSGYQLLGWGPSTMNAGDDLTIRLPKPNNSYNYYYYDSQEDKTGVTLGERISVTRGENAGKFVYSPVKPIQLTNEVLSQYFMFGNPTMAMIDLSTFIPANIDGATFYKMENDAWKAAVGDPEIMIYTGDRYLKPMESILLRLPNAGTEVRVSLDSEHLTTEEEQTDNSGNNSPTGGGTTISPAGVAPRRPVEKMTAQMMTIYADVYGTKARCILAAKDEAEDLYSLGEDALFISSGVEADVNDATATTPVNMYTLAKGVPMMVDVRENIDTVPMALLIHDYYRTDKVTFTFYLTDNWDKESYFCDAVTGTRTLITDSLVLEVAMPQNHEVRYYIDGPDVMNPDGGGDIWSSTEDVKTSTNQVWAYSPSQGQLVVASNDIIKAVTVYDIAGRLIGYRELEMQYNSTTFDTPTGACIVKAVLRDNTEHYISALVK